MRVEHEIGNRPLQPRQIGFQIDETRAGDFRRALEIHLAQCFAQFEMLLWIGYDGWLAESARGDGEIGAFIGTVRHIGGGNIGDYRQGVAQDFLQIALFRLALLDGVLQPGDFVEERLGLGLVFFCLGLADQLGGFIAPSLLGLQPREQVAQCAVLAEQILGKRGAVQATPVEARREGVGIVANEPDVVHGRTFGAWPTLMPWHASAVKAGGKSP